MNLNDLLEAEGKQLVIIYPGRFHPFHIGHGKVYKYLKQKYSNAKVFISTSGKTDGDRSPFTFEEKKKMMMLAGVDSSVIVQSKSPYRSPEITEMFDPDKIVVVFAVSEKDMENDPRFDFSNGVNYKKNGEPAHFQKWEGMESADTVRKHSYIATTPTFPFTIRGTEINSASQIRNMISKSDDTELSQILQDLYNVADIPQDVMDIFKRKIGNSTMNENWNEDLTSAFLIEDNTMKTGILTTITEGKSPHKKGTKKYKAHMAAMHAESFDEEFDAKVKQVVESKLKNVAADIKDYVDDHKDHFDAYPMDVEVNGKVYDFDDYWKILDKVYPTAYDNHYAVEGKEQLEEAFFLAPWILPALATAVRLGVPALKILLKTGKNAAGKVKVPAGNAATSIIKNPGTTLSWVGGGYVFKSVYDVIEKVKEVVGDFMDDLSIEKFAEIVWKHKLPVAAVMAVLYGGKKLKDYMAGEEEQTGNTTINNYYNGELATEVSEEVQVDEGTIDYSNPDEFVLPEFMWKFQEKLVKFSAGTFGVHTTKDSSGITGMTISIKETTPYILNTTGKEGTREDFKNTDEWQEWLDYQAKIEAEQNKARKLIAKVKETTKEQAVKQGINEDDVESDIYAQDTWKNDWRKAEEKINKYFDGNEKYLEEIMDHVTSDSYKDETGDDYFWNKHSDIITDNFYGDWDWTEAIQHWDDKDIVKAKSIYQNDFQQNQNVKPGNSSFDDRRRDSEIMPVVRRTSESEDEDGVSAEDLVDIIMHRIKMNKPLMLALLGDEGPGPLMNAVEDVADFYSGTTEVGSSDVSAMVDAVKRTLFPLDYHKFDSEPYGEAYNPETGRDPNVDTTEWDELIAKAKKKQKEKKYANSKAGKRDPAYRHYHQYKTQEK